MTKLEIINSSLMKCGLPLAADISEADYNALHVYDSCVETVLRSHAWSFARRYASLERIENTRSFGPRYAYKLPGDFINLIDVRKGANLNAPCGEHETVGKTLYCNMMPCHARYTARVGVEEWPADFTDAVATLIAARIAGLSSEKMSLVPQLMQLYTLALQLAQSTDARETRSRVPSDNPFMNARREAGQNR